MTEQMTKPVIVYGASGYTGRLVCEYLREFNLPFVAAGRPSGSGSPICQQNPGRPNHPTTWSCWWAPGALPAAPRA